MADLFAPTSTGVTPQQIGAATGQGILASDPTTRQTSYVASGNSPAVISSTTVTDKTIPQNNAKLAAISPVPQAPTTTTETSQPTPSSYSLPSNFADTHDMSNPYNQELAKNALNTGGGEDTSGKFYVTDKNGNQVVNQNYDYTKDPSYTAHVSALDQLKQTTDATTAAQIDNIKEMFEARKSQLQQIALSQQDARNAMLVSGGGNRYSLGDTGIIPAMSAKMISDIASLDSQEQSAILQAQAAQNAQDYKVLNDKLNLADEYYKKKQEALQKLSDATLKDNEEIKKKTQQATTDSAIAKLYGSGVTDPAQILQKLHEQGNKDITSKDVNDSLANIVPKGLDDLVKTMRANNAPQATIQQVLSDAATKGMNAAYMTAGNYGAGGTGIVGEYNYAKANGYSGSFSQYQNEDANRKKAVNTTINTGIGADGKPQYSQQAQDHAKQVLAGNETMQQVPAAWRDQVASILSQAEQESYSPLASSRFTMASSRITKPFTELPQYQLTANGLPYLQRIDAAMKTPGSVSDQDLLDSLTKLNTAGNAITDAQVKIITDGRSFSDAINVWGNKLKGGGVLSDNQRQQIQEIAKNIYANYAKGYQPVFDQASKQLTDAGIPKSFWTIPDLNNLNDLDKYGNAGSIVADDKAAQSTISTFYNSDPKHKAVIDQMGQAFPDKSASWVLEQLRAKGVQI